MHYFMKTISLLCFLSLALLTSQAFGLQSVAAPKGNAKKRIMLESRIAESMSAYKVIEEEIDTLAKSNEKLSLRLTELKSKQSKLSVSTESYPEVIKSLHSQRVQLLVSLAGIEARREALLVAKEELQATPINDDVLKPMLESIKLREELLNLVEAQARAADAPRSRVLEAKLALLHAKTQLAELKLSSRNSAAMGQLDTSLLETSLELADQKARLAQTKLLISSIEPVFKDIKSCRSEISSIFSSLRSKGTDLRNLQVDIDNYQEELDALKN